MVFLIALIAGFDYNLEYSGAIAYDNNIWEYSPQSLDDFTRRVRPYRFPFETYDDLATRHDIGLIFRTRSILERTTTLNFRAVASSHLINREKDHQTFETGLRQSLGKFALKIDYLYLPRYLIKYYPDPVTAEYTQCAFTEHLLGFKSSLLAVARAVFHLRVSREWDNYVPAFRIYDTQAWRIGAELDLSVNRLYEPSISYEFKDALARGPVPDLSYRQHSGSIKNFFNLRFPRLAKLSLDYRVDYRIYTTDLPPDQDTPHSGRVDATHRLALDVSMPLVGFLGLTAGYDYEFRRASSPNYPEIGAVKDYDKYLLSGGIKFHY
jgi:hypothetical protein